MRLIIKFKKHSGFVSVGFEKVWFRPLKMTCFLFIRIANKALQALQFGAPLPRRHVLLGPRSPGKRQGRLYFPGKWNLVSSKKKGYPGKLQALSRHFLKKNCSWLSASIFFFRFHNYIMIYLSKEWYMILYVQMPKYNYTILLLSEKVISLCSGMINYNV